MKSLVLIFTILLSFIFGEGRTGDVCVRNHRAQDTITGCAERGARDTKADLSDQAILPARTASFSGDGSSFAPSLRSTSSGRRVQPSSKSGFRIIKAGRVFDRNNFYTFQTVILQFQSGIHSNSRYIHSICQLLI